MFNFKKSLLFVSILLILCISLGAVSAADIDVNDIESDDSIQGISIDSTIAVDGNDNGNGGDSAISNLKSDENTFSALNATINSGKTEITLENDYAFDETTDGDFVKGIVIDKTMTIDGQGHTISGSNLARIFNITGIDVIIKNVTFINGKATDNGGAIYSANAEALKAGSKVTTYDNPVTYSLKLENCYFENNNATNGGAIYTYLVKTDVLNSTFVNNFASTSGGAIYSESNERNTKYSVYGDDNYVHWGDILTVNNSKFISNTAEGANGGAIYYFRPKGGCFENTIFENNVAFCAGAVMLQGSIWVKHSTDLINCKFINNTGTYYLGAVYYGYVGYSDVKNCEFINNTGAAQTGALQGYECYNLNIDGCTFDNNKVTEEEDELCGGAVFLWEARNCTISNSVFSNNSVSDNGYAGAVYLVNDKSASVFACKDLDTYCSIENCNFTNNKASYGAAIYLGQGSVPKTEGLITLEVTIDNCYFNGNEADEGVVLIDNLKKSNIVNSKFIDNTASKGSAIYNCGNLNITDSSATNIDGDNKVPIYNQGNITSKTIITVLDNSSYLYYGEITLNATITTSDIPVSGETLVFYINGEEVTATETASGLYTATYDKFITGDQIVSASCAGATDVEVKTGILLKRFYTFTDLQALINEAGDELNLPNDFYYDPNVDAALKNGVVINKPITINGNGHTIDGKNLARIFDVASIGVTINNLTFTNANISGANGAAIYYRGSTGGTINDCIFENNFQSGADAGIVYAGYDSNLKITNSKFINNTATGATGAIVMSRSNLELDGCVFDLNNGKSGIIFLEYAELNSKNSYLIAKNTNFTNNLGTHCSSIYLNDGQESNITGCLFENNTANRHTLFIGWADKGAKKVTISECVFNNNKNIGTDNSWRGALLSNAPEVVIEGCNFTNNKAYSNYTDESVTEYIKGAGAIMVWDVTKINNCNFISNDGGNVAGALYIYSDINVDVVNSKFVDNTAKKGSAIYNRGNLNITDSSATNIDGDNKAPIYNLGTITSKTVITVLDNSSYALVDGKALLNATITTSDIPVTGGDLVFSINGETVTATETETGLYEVEYTNPITKNQVVTASYDGANDVEVKTGRIIINPKYVVIVLAEDTEFVAGAGKEYVIGITSDNVAIADYKVILELVNGDIRKNYTLTTDENGQVALAINLAYARNYTFNIYFEAQDDYLSNSASQNISVIPLNTSLTTKYGYMEFETYSGEWIANLTDSNNDAIINTYVDVHFKKVGSDDERIYKLKSDNEGKIKLPLNLRYIGEYSVYAEFKGNSKYSSSKSNETTINIIASTPTRLVTSYKDNILVTTNNSGDDFSVQLLDAPAEVGIKGAKLHINFTNSNGIGPVYNVTTDSNGFAYLKLNLSYAGDYKADVFFDGDNTYRPIEKGSCITIIRVEKNNIIE